MEKESESSWYEGGCPGRECGSGDRPREMETENWVYKNSRVELIVKDPKKEGFPGVTRVRIWVVTY